MAEQKEIYPKGTEKKTDEFQERLEAKNVAMEIVEKVAKETTEKAFKKFGKEKASKEKQDVNHNNGEYGNGERYGSGTEEDEFNVTISKTKGAKSPSYLQKVTTIGGKKCIGEINMELKGTDLSIEYQNTEAASFIDGKKINKKTLFTDILKPGFEKKLTKLFQDISDAEVSYLLNTKIGNDDKIEKNMNDSIVNENRITSIDIKDLLSDSFEDVDNSITSMIHESKKKDDDPDKKDEKPLLLGDEEKKTKTIKERDAELKEITTSGPAIQGTTFKDGAQSGAGGFNTPDILDKKKGNKPIGEEGEVVADKENILTRKFQSPQISEAVKNTSYGQAQKQRPRIKKTISEDSYPNAVELIPGSGYVPKGMDSNTMVGGNPEVEINSQEELDIANYGTHGKKTGKKPAARPNLKKSEAEAKKLEESYVPRRKFAINEENEKKGVNKRYIIADEVSQDKLNERWNQLCKFTKDESIEEKEVISESVVLGLGFESDETAEKTVSREEGEIQNEKEFEQNNLETPAASNSEECDDFEMIDKASPKGEVSSLAVYKIDKQDLQENKAYVIDHFTKKLVLNPKYDSKK